jgi:hypothetical protein
MRVKNAISSKQTVREFANRQLDALLMAVEMRELRRLKAAGVRSTKRDCGRSQDISGWHPARRRSTA